MSSFAGLRPKQRGFCTRIKLHFLHLSMLLVALLMENVRCADDPESDWDDEYTDIIKCRSYIVIPRWPFLSMALLLLAVILIVFLISLGLASKRPKNLGFAYYGERRGFFNFDGWIILCCFLPLAIAFIEFWRIVDDVGVKDFFDTWQEVVDSIICLIIGLLMLILMFLSSYLGHKRKKKLLRKLHRVSSLLFKKLIRPKSHLCLHSFHATQDCLCNRNNTRF